MDPETLTQRKPLDYVKMLFRRKWLIILPAVIGIVFGIIAANVLPKVFESSTLILVEEGRVINPLVKGLAVSTSVAQRIDVLREQMLGWDRVNQLISKLGLAKDVRSQQDFEDLVLTLRKHIRVKLYGQNIIRISYQGKDPAQSMNIVKTITDIFIAENLKQQNSETENAISFINDQLGLYQKKLKQSEISAMEEKLDTLLVDSTDKHPMVIDLKKKIATAKVETEKGNYAIGDSAIAGSDTELASLKEELKGLRDELATSSLDTERGGENRAKLATATNEKLYKLLLLDKVERVTAQDAGVNQKLYNELLARLETAKITQRLEASRDGTRYIILDPARLPLKPIKPNKLYLLLASMFMGMCLGIGLVFAVEMFDHSFLGVDDAKAFLELLQVSQR
jgi:uncharacterized protein involved in exopolysaccharide biosynthesis